MKPNATNEHNWYLVYTCPNSERKIYNELNRREITAFLPTRKEVRQWSDRKKKVETPLFPNYVFVKVPPKEMWMILLVNGVVRFISFDGEPVVVKDTEIDVVKKITSAGDAVKNENFCVKGEKVQVKAGPLAGLIGSVVDRKGITRLYVELKTAQQIISVDIEASLLEKVV